MTTDFDELMFLHDARVKAHGTETAEDILRAKYPAFADQVIAAYGEGEA